MGSSASCPARGPVAAGGLVLGSPSFLCPFTPPQIQQMPNGCPIPPLSGAREAHPSPRPQLKVLCWDRHSLPRARADSLHGTGAVCPCGSSVASSHSVSPSFQGAFPGTSRGESAPRNRGQGGQPWSLCRCALSSVGGRSEEPECLGWHSVPLRGAPQRPLLRTLSTRVQ